MCIICELYQLHSLLASDFLDSLSACRLSAAELSASTGMDKKIVFAHTIWQFHSIDVMCTYAVGLI